MELPIARQLDLWFAERPELQAEVCDGYRDGLPPAIIWRYLKTLNLDGWRWSADDMGEWLRRRVRRAG